MIPKLPEGTTCPEGTTGAWAYATCFCSEPHCSWEKCRLSEPPDECLIGTGSIWLWDSQKNYWVAQTYTRYCKLNNQNIICYVIKYHYIF